MDPLVPEGNPHLVSVIQGLRTIPEKDARSNKAVAS